MWKDTTPDLFKEYLEDMEKRKIGQGEEDIFGVNFYNYYLIENDEIIGTSSIRTNIKTIQKLILTDISICANMYIAKQFCIK